jgi:two-component system OmpR family response regulator
MRLLLLEDDRETADALQKGLEREGHSVALASDAGTALELVAKEKFPVVVLDVMVPGGSGYDVLEAVRASRVQTAVLMLTARGSVSDRVEGLDRGADDYLVKPFSFSELSARVRAMGRRFVSQTSLFCLGELEVDVLGRVVRHAGSRIDLTPTEFSLLVFLLRAGGEPRSRSDLLRDVWGYDFDPGTNVVDVHVNRLRRKLESAGAGGVVRTVRGSGYAAG